MAQILFGRQPDMRFNPSWRGKMGTMPAQWFSRLTHISVLLVGILTLKGGSGSTPVPQTEADFGWMREHFGPVFNELVPISPDAGEHVSYRSHRDFHTEVPEYSFVIGYDRKENGPGLPGNLSAHVREADSVSIYDQMMNMHRANPQEDAASIQKKIKLKTWDLTELSCPAVRAQFNKFRRLHFGTPPFQMLIDHPLIHELQVRTSAGNMDLILMDDDPAVKWALKTRQALQTCAVRMKSR